MTDKKFEKVPQVEIDDNKYHESAQVSFGIQKEVKTKDVGGNEVTTRVYRLVKYILVGKKIANEEIVRTEEGSSGKLIILNQMSIEIKKEIKRMESV